MNAYELSLKLIGVSAELESALDRKEKAKTQLEIKDCDNKIDEIESEFLKIKKTLKNISVRDL